MKVGIVTTGNEVYHGRIEDKFGPIIMEKIKNLGSTVMRQILVSDNTPMTVAAIHELINEGAEMIVATGGMSVDPDDRTPASIRAAGGKVVTYGSPTFPGAMFMLAYIGEVPVIGIPGCAMYNKATVFDLIVPRILAGETVTRADITSLGHGGLCSRLPRVPLSELRFWDVRTNHTHNGKSPLNPPLPKGGSLEAPPLKGGLRGI